MGVTADVVVAGGGAIGAAIAWRAASAGLAVVVVDPGSGDAASQVAAGMLAPVSEATFGEEDLLALNLAAAARFPSFTAELEDLTGHEVGLRTEGTLAVAYDASDHAALARLTQFRRSAGLGAETLDARACRKLEPFLAPDVQGGVLFAGDASVDNRRFTAALLAAMSAVGARMVRGRVSEVLTRDGAVSGVRLAAGGAQAGGPEGGTETIEAGAAVIAAGCGSATIAGLPAGLAGAIRPVKGQLLRLRHPAALPPVLGHTVRATVRGAEVYLVPRADGEVVAGATVEERGYDRTVTAGAVYELLRDAACVLPVITELVFAEACAGSRPATPDNGPAVGVTSVPGLLVASGHYRNGILLSPATADAVVALLTGGAPAPEWEPFSPDRFAAVTS